jgi:sigma-B regulation protein RsbU (phosphoserine phosphatase)
MSFKISEGGYLLLYTDCLLEAKNKAGESFGVERIMKAFAEAPNGSPHEIVAYVTAMLQRFTGDKAMDDDLTIVAVKV